MRFVMRTCCRPLQAGLTLVELLVGMAIAGILLTAAAPAFSDYITNARLREAGNMLYSQALIAQSEAIKRNTVIQLSTNGSSIQLIDLTNPAADPVVVLSERQLVDGVGAGVATVNFTGEGRTANFVAGSINVTSTQITCTSEIRCPGLRVDGGGAIRLCKDHTASC